MGFNRASFECINSFAGKTLWTYWTKDNIASMAVIGAAVATYWNNIYVSYPNVATGDLVLALQEENAGSGVLTAWVVKNVDAPNSSSMLRVL